MTPATYSTAYRHAWSLAPGTSYRETRATAFLAACRLAALVSRDEAGAVREAEEWLATVTTEGRS